MIKTPVVVKSEKGLDGRPIALLVQEASQYASKVYIQVGQMARMRRKPLKGSRHFSLKQTTRVLYFRSA